MGTILWRDLDPFGAEVDVDLGNELTASQQEELRDLFFTRQLLVFRGQDIDREQQIRLMALAGPVIADEPDTTTISNQSALDGLGPLELSFHSDLSFSPEPYRAISLAARQLEDGRSSTRFANTARAYAALPDADKTRLAGLRALNVFSRDVSGRNREANLLPTDPRIAGPIVRTHPETGELLLFVNQNATDRIVDLPADESETLLAELFAALYGDRNVHEHVWRMGDVVMWDNLAVQHGRADVSGAGVRILQKVVVGPKGFLEQHPEFGRQDFIDRDEVQVEAG